MRVYDFEKSCRDGRFVFQNQQFHTLQFRQSNCPSAFIEEFNFKYVGSLHLDDSPDLSSDQAFCGFIFEERDYIQQFDRHVLHVRFIARNK